MPANGKPRIAVFKLASCDGCQLQMLNLEDELLAIAGQVEICYFLEARSRILDGPYDVALIEGSVTTEHDLEHVREIRRKSQMLITLGACANTGGIQALRNLQDLDEYTRAIYANPAYIRTLSRSTPVASHVTVDFGINGCPISREQLLEVLTSLLIGRSPQLAAHSVCVECKGKGTVCVLVAKGTPCLGLVTHAGCGAVCPSFGRGCFACYGPMESAHADSLCQNLTARGIPRPEILRLLNGFTGWAENSAPPRSNWRRCRLIAANETRTIRLESMTRVEGEGGLRIEVHDGQLLDVKVDVFEAPRFFEAFLRGRSIREVPDITARICGICPFAHQMSSVQAIETALGITPGAEIRALRRLLYCSEWIESHALHIYLLQAPDFFGMESALTLTGEHPGLVKQGLELKKVGDDLMTVIGGRSVHPISLCIGGFWKVPRRSPLRSSAPPRMGSSGFTKHVEIRFRPETTGFHREL